MRVWMPYVRAASGVDVFTCRLAGAMAEFSIEAITESFPPAPASRCARPRYGDPGAMERFRA